MINAQLSIQNLFCREDFDSLFERSGKLFGNKNWEVQFARDKQNILEIKINTYFTGRHHAGPEVSIGLLGFVATAKIYDSRHWDYENNTWEKYE